MELFGVNSHILKPVGQSSAICSEKWHMLKGVNCLNFVFDCGSSDVTCPQIMFYWIVLCCYFLKVFGVCKLGLAEILLFFIGLRVPLRTGFSAFLHFLNLTPFLAPS